MSLIAQTSYGKTLFHPSDSSGAEDSEVIVKSNLKIYPNPAFDFIRLKESTGVKSLVIYNLVGRKVKKFDAEKGKSYRIADLPKGMYLVQLLGKDGKVLTTQRMSKK